VDVQWEQLVGFVEIIKQKLGTTFYDYLHPMYRLGEALGTDLQRFAGKGLMLIFFDTYERALAGNSLLRIAMQAAGVRVGWVIAGRNNLWSESGQIKDSGITYSYKDIVYYGRALAVDLNDQPFSVDDIMT